MKERSPADVRQQRCWMCDGSGIVESKLGERNGRAKLNAAQVRAMRRRKARGETINQLSELFGVSRTQVQHIVYRKQWTHVD